MRNDFSFESRDGVTTRCYSWLPAGETRAIVQIVHGSLEHALRYETFAEFLVGRGFAVYACDYRGHGATAATPEDLCYFSDQPGGWELALEDLQTLGRMAREKHPGKKHFMLGHSMGAFLVQGYICVYPDELDGAIASGTAGGRGLLLIFGGLMARLLRVFIGRKTRSPFLHKLYFGTLNKSVENPETDYDFVSRDPAQVQAYIDDPLCGVTVTTEYGVELMKGMHFVTTRAAFTRPRLSLPILMFSGEKCPLAGLRGKPNHVKRSLERYRRAGKLDVSLKIYPGARHETLNEINRDEVFADVAQWIEARL